jgi:hypothetical protein
MSSRWWLNILQMKYFIYCLILVNSIFFFSSCGKDFLTNTQSRNILYRQEYVVDLRTTGEFMNGIYPSLSTALFGGYQLIYPDLIADNIKPVFASSTTTPLIYHYNWEQEANSESTALSSSSINCNGISYNG